MASLCGETHKRTGNRIRNEKPEEEFLTADKRRFAQMKEEEDILS
jgi:hypothetical protein